MCIQKAKGTVSRKHTSPSTRLQTLLMTSNFRREVVTVSLATTVDKLLANLRFCVEVPLGEIAGAGTGFFR